MKDEIKEILELLKYISKNDITDKLVIDMLNSKEAKLLLDYITNLQEENKMYAQLKDNIEKNNFGIYKNILIWSAAELEEAKRIEQKSLDTINNLQERCEYLQRSCERKEDEILSLRDECVEGEMYKSRIDKAIEKIYKGIDSCNAILSNPEYTIVNKHTLLKIEMDNLQNIKNILEGSDKE